MKFSTVLKGMGLATMLALMYIHLQMNIVALAYQGTHRQKAILSLSEENGALIYANLMLKSAHNIGGRMLAENTSMTFVDPKNVIEIATAKMAPESLSSISVTSEAPAENSLLNFLAFSTRAEAGSR